MIVGHDETHFVARDRTTVVDDNDIIHIEHDRTDTVDKNQTVTIHGSHAQTVDANESVMIGGSHTESVGANESVTVGANRSENVAGALDLHAGGPLNLRGSLVTINDGGTNCKPVARVDDQISASLGVILTGSATVCAGP